MGIFKYQCPLPSLHGAVIRTPYPRGFDLEEHHADFQQPRAMQSVIGGA
jgi:hypothetical protein